MPYIIQKDTYHTDLNFYILWHSLQQIRIAFAEVTDSIVKLWFSTMSTEAFQPNQLPDSVSWVIWNETAASYF